MIIQLNLEDRQILQTYTNKLNSELRKRGVTFQLLPEDVAADILSASISVLSERKLPTSVIVTKKES